MAKKTIPVLRQHELISFGRRLRSWRKARRLSQEKLALTAGLDYSYVNEIENGKINLGLLTLLSLAQTLEIPPAALLLPVEQVRKLQNMPVLQVEDLESTFIHTLALPELLDIHCQFLLNYARAGHFKLARQWLEILQHWHSQHWCLVYTQARYLCLQVQLPPISYSRLAERPANYAAESSLEPALEQALACLQEAIVDPTPENHSTKMALTEPDLWILKQAAPARWSALFGKGD
jgi:transcriptional regulator with XRE-family HTH domain